ncbi:nitrate- and nitrite sensing domain-containing protein [Vibrio amylolyticus]
MLDGEIVNLALSYDDLAHNLAVERGLTAGVLGSKGNRKHLVQQIEQTQTCMSELENDARSVSNIVDTISGISEQTFLVWCGLRFSGLSRVVSFIF